jgi:hypothetical protein
VLESPILRSRPHAVGCGGSRLVVINLFFQPGCKTHPGMHTALQHGGGVDPGGSSCEEGKRRDPVAQRLSPAGASARAGASVVVSVVIRPAGRMTTDTGRSGIRMTFHGFPKHNPGSTPLHAISYTLDAAVGFFILCAAMARPCAWE